MDSRTEQKAVDLIFLELVASIAKDLKDYEADFNNKQIPVTISINVSGNAYAIIETESKSLIAAKTFD